MTLEQRMTKQLPSLHSLNGAKLLFPLHSASAYSLPWNLTWQQTSLPHRCIDLHNQRVRSLFYLLVGLAVVFIQTYSLFMPAGRLGLHQASEE